MNERQRYLETLTFGNPDRIPFSPGGGRESTFNRWHKEGLPEDIKDSGIANIYAYEKAGGKLKLSTAGPGFFIRESMIPEFEEKVIEKKQTSQIVQDWKGNICEISNEFNTRYLRNAIDFVTRRWIKCPVESRQDWKKMKLRYDPSDISRLPENAEGLKNKLQDRDYPVRFHFSGPFWQLREWLGFENLCMAFHDNPSLVAEMIEFWSDYVSELFKISLNYVTPDCFHISEDMAYKGFSMISPQMCKEFIMPTWKKWGQMVHDAGIPIYAIDSDGYIGELIPIWIETGMNVTDPLEVAAGNDINVFRKKFGKNMAFCGGVDKRCIAQGGKSIEDEVIRLRPAIKSGGYIPGCDHAVPHDVSWPNYMYYVKLLAKETGWL
ncbi:MAG: uroporphyrinogen decarboxylase family protein [Nitrospinales bacterium]